MNLPSDDNLATLRGLITSGRTIEAIKLYREINGVGLKEAKDAVEAMEEAIRSGGAAAAPATLEQAAASHRSFNDQSGALHELLFNGEKIKAIKLHREATGLSLREAKEQIDAMETALRQSHSGKFKASGGSGCTVTTAAFFLCLAGALYHTWRG